MQNLCLEGGTFVVDKGVFLNWRGRVQFMFWMTIRVLKGI